VEGDASTNGALGVQKVLLVIVCLMVAGLVVSTKGAITAQDHLLLSVYPTVVEDGVKERMCTILKNFHHVCTNQHLSTNYAMVALVRCFRVRLYGMSVGNIS
jgi:hypothetical protein